MVVPLAPQHAVHAVAVADFDGDGDDDLVYASDVDRVVCIWTIDAVAEGAPRCWPLDELVPSQMAVADLDGDGVAEVALGDATAATVWLWDVDLASDEMALVGLATPAPTDLVLLADLQHDVAPDLITAHAASKTLSIRLGVP